MTTLERVSPAFSIEPPRADLPELSKSTSVAELPSKAELHDALRRVFLGVLLLTADFDLAGIAVSESVNALDIKDLTTETLPICASRLVLQLQPDPFNHTRVPYLLALPAELENVMRLPPELRHSFVLETLMGITRPVCAELLQLNEDQVRARTCAAAVALARTHRPSLRSSRAPSLLKGLTVQTRLCRSDTMASIRRTDSLARATESSQLG
jgi:hypothetical protein